MSYVEVSRPDPAVGVITLNRPERMHAMSYDVMVPFRAALDEVGADGAVRAVVVTAAVETGQRIARLSQPGVELTKKSLQAGMAASSLEAHLTSEGLGQLYLRLLTDNFEESTRARKEGREPVFRDRRA